MTRDHLAADPAALTAYGEIVHSAMLEVQKAESDFGDCDWFNGAEIIRTIALLDGTEWQITVGRPEQSA